MNTTLYISNLPLSMDSADLEDMFTMIGNVSSAKILRETHSDSSLGRGVVEMATRSEAENGVLHYHRQVVGGQTLMVAFAEALAKTSTALKTSARKTANVKILKRVIGNLKRTK